MILPTTFEPGQEATFTFRFLQQKHPKHHSLVFINNVRHQYHSCAFIWLYMDHNRGWYRVLSHGQAKLKSVDSTPAIIKSAIVKVTILSGNRAWTISTIFLRLPPPWQTPRALSNTTLSSCSSQTTEEPSMPLNCRSISIMTLHILYILNQLLVFILNNIPKIFFNGCDHFMSLGSSSSINNYLCSGHLVNPLDYIHHTHSWL